MKTTLKVLGATPPKLVKMGRECKVRHISYAVITREPDGMVKIWGKAQTLGHLKIICNEAAEQAGLQNLFDMIMSKKPTSAKK